VILTRTRKRSLTIDTTVSSRSNLKAFGTPTCTTHKFIIDNKGPVRAERQESAGRPILASNSSAPADRHDHLQSISGTDNDVAILLSPGTLSLAQLCQTAGTGPGAPTASPTSHRAQRRSAVINYINPSALVPASECSHWPALRFLDTTGGAGAPVTTSSPPTTPCRDQCDQRGTSGGSGGVGVGVGGRGKRRRDWLDELLTCWRWIRSSSWHRKGKKRSLHAHQEDFVADCCSNRWKRGGC